MRYLILVLAAAAGSLRGQAEFAAASIRPYSGGMMDKRASEMEGVTVSPVTVRMSNISLRACIRWAYDLPDSQIFGPGWLSTQQFDIAATAGRPSTVAEMRGMMRQLLAERFQMTVRREERALPVYAMTVKRQGKLKAGAGAECGMSPEGGALVFHGCTMGELAERLALRPLRLDRPVVDRTGLGGRFDFRLELAGNMGELKQNLENAERGVMDGGPSMISILEGQLGLGFRGEKAPVLSVIVERIERMPTAN